MANIFYYWASFILKNGEGKEWFAGGHELYMKQSKDKKG